MGALALSSLLLAALAAGGNAVANVMQRKASLQQAPERRFGVSLLVDLLASSTWLIGFSAMVASFVLQAVALGLGQLSAVETVITLEVPLTVLVASAVFGVHVGRAEWSGVLTMTAGMIVLIATLNPRAGNESDVADSLYLLAGSATVAAIAALLLLAQRGARLARTACLGAAAGTSFGLTATLLKATVSRLSTHGVVAVLTTWQTYAAVGLGVLGVITMQWALHTGPLLAAQPGFTLMDPLVSVFWGVLVFDEPVRTGIWLLPALTGAAGIAVGVVLLARSPLLTAVSEDAASAGADTAAARAPHGGRWQTDGSWG